MSADRFERIVDHLPSLGFLMLHGIGEPTLNPEYPKLVELAARTGRFTTISANSHGLSRSIDYFHRLVDAGMSHLSISVDSLTQAIADITRTGTNVRRLRERIAAIAALPIPVSITMVASRFNLADLPSTLDTLNQLGRFDINIQPFFDLGRADGCLTAGDLAAVRRTIPARVTARWPNLTIDLVLSLSGTPPPALCEAPWTSPAITVDGYLTPCCVMWDPSTLGLVNIAEIDVDDAFSLPSVRAFVDDYRRCAPGFCGACPKNSRPVLQEFAPLLRHPSERVLSLVRA